MLVYLLIAFNLGLFSTLHCIGMCGGIISALMLAKEEDSTNNSINKINLSFAYNFGRISSYALAGLICGFLGESIITLSSELNLHLILQIFAAVVLFGIAINILGLIPFNQFIESFGMRLWKYLQPLGKNLLPINSIWKAVLFGMVWGWLPCGLVYSALLISISTGSALNGMIFMFAFGLGTLPGLVSAGYFSGKLVELRNNKNFRVITGVFLIIIAISLPLSSFYFTEHHSHSSHSHQNH